MPNVLIFSRTSSACKLIYKKKHHELFILYSFSVNNNLMLIIFCVGAQVVLMENNVKLLPKGVLAALACTVVNAKTSAQA